MLEAIRLQCGKPENYNVSCRGVNQVWQPGKRNYSCLRRQKFGFGKRGLLEKGSFQKSPFSRDSRDSRDSREPPDYGKERRFRPFSRDSREFRDFGDSRDFSSKKTPFVMTPFSGPEKCWNRITKIFTTRVSTRVPHVRRIWYMPHSIAGISRHFESGRKKQPKDRVFGKDIPGTSGTHTSGYP